MKTPLIGARLPSGLAQTARGWLSVFGLLAALACIGASGSQAQSPPAAGPASAAQPQAAASAAPPAAAPAVDPARQQIEGECASLLQLATVLKTEVDRTTMDQLSISVVLKAGQIEQLAHKVRGEMKAKVGDQ